jgi:hypothetical protein
MNKKKNTAIVKEMTWGSSTLHAVKTESPASHFTLIDARDLFTKKDNSGSASKFLLKIIYLNKNINTKTNN